MRPPHWEAGAFHPAMMLLRKHTVEGTIMPAFPCRGTTDSRFNAGVCGGLNWLQDEGSLRIPLRAANARLRKSGRRHDKKKLAYNHLTNEALRFILQGCRRIGTQALIKPPFQWCA